MKDKTTHGGAGLITREYEVRELDQHGDAMDVDHHDNKRSAMKAACEAIARENVAAVVVELHTAKFPAHLFADPDAYQTVAMLGDKAALKEGGWK